MACTTGILAIAFEGIWCLKSLWAALVVWEDFCRIGDDSTPDFGKRRERMHQGAGHRHDVLGAEPPDQQGVSDERAMTTPRNGFGAHHGDPVAASQLDQLVEILLEFRGLHVVRVTSKGGVSPSDVDGIAVGMAQAAESRHMHVAQSRRLQRFRQPILVELRIVERARHRAYVRDTGNSMGLQQSDKLIEWAVRVANSQRNWQDSGPGFRLSRDFERFHLTGKRADLPV
jgi:hypothetical protein